ncbi:putative retrotransposon hot spot (RHS) protein [Trypanosoma cruzi]|uniref:Retrotransposon hot spot (RHS) protein, putative n=2 Tax=Trypanosoma cruzi TaxID=5693 RepID=Q4DVI6_TRYCC|nr:retrotransposon hot spot (RHS) protein, putative [Trypanosoma cruzi]EAN96544.1 retrotransposon hot spot (RHS) protein, putative [Trypanosoma cruzi]PWV17592.1 putative retrotransposon hot spot (RHS) protein [Trypanosoma cruzi]|eukprot:XP_818395.1 retrotransposon hot spot (RHS) protein [Trypanosoma cruzi strain CL Brener]
MHARIYSCRVCAVSAVPQGCGTVASGMRGRTLRAHHVVVIVCSHQHCAGWLAPTRRRCGGPRAFGVPSHCVDESLAVAASHDCAYFLSYSSLVCWSVFSLNSIQPIKQGETMPGNQASAVPQGDGQRRARPESEGERDQPDATRIRAEEMHRPRWSMRSTVKDIVLEGSTNRNNMKLNEFLRSYLGEESIVERNGNVTMDAFVQDPDDYVQDQRLLEVILNLTAYQELDAIYELHCVWVNFLWQWNRYERRDTVIPLARGKLNAALSQVLTRKRRKAEERREAKERAAREKQVGFTLNTAIRSVLFRGRVRVMDIRLNDFLVMELDGIGVMPGNRNVLLKEFVKDCTRYMLGEFLLHDIKTSDRYKRMERAVREEMDMEEDVNKLHKKGVDNLLKWSLAAEEVKRSVHEVTKQFLDAAFIELMSSMTMSAPMKLEGNYESVYNAGWHHVVEVPGGEGTGMEVREGEPPQPWTYKAVGDTLERDDGVEQSGAALLRLMVLASDKGWPYSWNLKGAESTRDCHVNFEVERVWQIVKGDLTAWFSTDGGTDFKPRRRVLIGTPGIGKSMNAGSYLLYQLLHYDAEQLPMVAYVIGSQSFLFDKTIKTVSVYMGDPRIEDVVDIFSLRGVTGYIIYDAALAFRQTPACLPCKGWGMIVVTPPEKSEYEWWAKKMDATAIVTNCPEENDVRAMCIWMKRNRPLQEQAEYWKEVRGRMNNVGPILRSIFDKQAYDDRIKACQQAVDGSTASELERNLGIGCCYSSNDNDLSRKLVKVVRVRRGNNIESPLNLLVSPHLERETLSRLENEMKQSDFIFFVLRFWDYVPPYIIEKYAVSAFLNEEFLRAIRLEIKELRPPGRREPHSCVLKEHSDTSFTRKEFLPPPERLSNPVAMDHWVLYEPKVQSFPLVDAFFFVDSNPMTLVGLRMATAGGHHTTTSTVRQFTECLAAYFNGWEELYRDMSWEIIYVQHADSTPMTEWKRCDVVNSNNVSRAENREIAAFWREEVRQYIAAI